MSAVNLDGKSFEELVNAFEKLVDMEVETEYRLSIIKGAKEKVLFHIDKKVDNVKRKRK